MGQKEQVMEPASMKMAHQEKGKGKKEDEENSRGKDSKHLYRN